MLLVLKAKNMQATQSKLTQQQERTPIPCKQKVEEETSANALLPLSPFNNLLKDIEACCTSFTPGHPGAGCEISEKNSGEAERKVWGPSAPSASMVTLGLAPWSPHPTPPLAPNVVAAP